MSILQTPQEAEARSETRAAGPRPDDSDLQHAAIGSVEQQGKNAGGFFRGAVLRRLARLQRGRLTVIDSGGSSTFGEPSNFQLEGTINVHRHDFYRAIALGGSLSAAESYIRGDWDSSDLTSAMRVLAQNMDVLAGVDSVSSRLFRPVRVAAHWLRRNTRAGSKRNIAAHYDLSNEFFSLMLDPSMTYSCAVFPSPDSTLEEASVEKYDRICRKLDLRPADHVVEIGTGWGGFAEHAVKHYGCRVTTTTISDQQHAYAERRFRAAGLAERITLLKKDYRDLSGQFDKLVSIEMIEAVGEKYLSEYFAQCSRLLQPEGMMCLQAITIPDHRFDRYRRSVDFIQRYIFPGGFLPSLGAMAECIKRGTDFRFFHVEEFGSHYAETLSRWRHEFWREIDRVKGLGFDQRFIRTWHYYLCYCEAGFRERQIGVSQITLIKPACRREPLLLPVAR